MNLRDPDKVRAFVDEILMSTAGDIGKGVGLKIGEIADSYFDIRIKTANMVRA